ncbi:MAG: hypothetical protein GF353_02475 [Candidatus Lokiarchaeota archaeon]|nr:hypothetical protein [Candidatus Lokiarchaeota archaeon]
MIESSKYRELYGKQVIGYNLGYFGVYTTNMLISVFVFQFYVYTINLNSFIAALGLFFQLIFGAFFSIIFGVLIDNKKPGKRGKRRPFLLYGLPFWGITSFMLWIPPWYCPKENSFYLPVTVYYWTVLILNSLSGNLILVAHSSMLPEQSQTIQNRKKIASVGTVFNIFGSFIAMLFPLIIQSVLSEPENAKWWESSGKVVIKIMPFVGGIFTIFGVIAILATYSSVDESFLYQTIFKKKKSIIEIFKEMKRPANDKKFKKFVLASFFIQFAGRIIALAVMPFLIYVLLFQGAEFFIYMVVSICCKLGWFFVWRLVLKHVNIIKAFSICLLFSVIASGFELIYLIEVLSFEFKVAIFFVSYGTVMGTMYAVGLFQNPLSSALIDEAAVNSGGNISNVSKISGGYSGLNVFMLTIGQAVASIVVGIILIGNNSENSTIITLIMASGGLAYFIAFLFIMRINLSEIKIKG